MLLCDFNMHIDFIMSSERLPRQEFLRSMSPHTRLEFLNKEKEEKIECEKECLRVYSVGVPLVFDFSYTNCMKISEIYSMVNQVRLSIGFLRKQNNQVFKLLCSSVSNELGNYLLKKGSISWKLDFYKEDLKEIELLKGREIIILSPDAEEILSELDIENAIYVIGGIVDKTVKTRETYNRAQNLGLKCVKLPIKETISAITNPFKLKKVLNINTVVEILHYKALGESWESSLLKSIPSRWLKTS